jgi:8-oxo-dGTP diphosphatase
LTKTINVVCAIIERDGTILAARRSDAQSHGGFWEFPGGKIDPGENAEQAIIREIKEELQADIIAKRRLQDTTFSYPDKTVTLIPFICTVAFGTPKPLEHAEIRWVDMKESFGLEWLPPDKAILENYWKRAF